MKKNTTVSLVFFLGVQIHSKIKNRFEGRNRPPLFLIGMIASTACARQLNESTQAWLERLIAIDAPAAQINGVTAILQRETAGKLSHPVNFIVLFPSHIFTLRFEIENIFNIFETFFLCFIFFILLLILVEAYYIAGKPSPDSKSRVRVDIQLTNSVNNMTVVVKDVLVDDGYTETLCIKNNIAKQLGLKKSKMSHDLKLGNGSIVKEHKYIIGRKQTDFLACQIMLEPCGFSSSGVVLKESISGLESNVPQESSSKSSLVPSDKKRKHDESASEQEGDVEDDNEDEREYSDEKTAKCFLFDVYCDDSENIIGAKALALLGVLVDCGTGLRKYLRQKV